MELKWLEDFLSLVDTRNFSRSAEQRGTTQPAFSRRIKALEEWVGSSLFDRSVQPIALTHAGEQFRFMAEEVVSRLYQGREEIKQASTGAASAIKFMATHSLSLTFFPSWVRPLQDTLGAMNIRLDTGYAEACVQAMIKGSSHFMLCHTHSSVETGLDPRYFDSKRVGVDLLLPVTAADETLPGTKGAPCRYLAYAETSAIGRAVEHMLMTRGATLNLERAFTSHLAAVLKSMVRDGAGLAWLPASQVSDELASGQLRRAGDETWDIGVEIHVFRPREQLIAAAETFWKRIAEEESGALQEK